MKQWSCAIGMTVAVKCGCSCWGFIRVRTLPSPHPKGTAECLAGRLACIFNILACISSVINCESEELGQWVYIMMTVGYECKFGSGASGSTGSYEGQGRLLTLILRRPQPSKQCTWNFLSVWCLYKNSSWNSEVGPLTWWWLWGVKLSVFLLKM